MLSAALQGAPGSRETTGYLLQYRPGIPYFEIINHIEFCYCGAGYFILACTALQLILMFNLMNIIGICRY
jgi:hypothetical protein